MTILDDILDASTNPQVSTSDLLRKVQIAATRLGAQDIVDWARAEIAGYDADASVPKYRHLHANVMGLFVGPMQHQITHHLTAIPDGMEDRWEVDLRQPLVEIQALADDPSDNDPRREWSVYDVKRYTDSDYFSIQFYVLFSVWNSISKQSLRGIVDVIRSRAMEFALDLQMKFPDAGSPGGPTVQSEPALAQTIYNITNNITGHGTNVSAGPGAQQTSTVNVGDLDGLRQEVARLVVDESERDEFVAAIEEDGDTGGSRVRGFLDRVRSGAVRLGEGLTTDVAAETLVALGRGFLGL